MADDKQKKNEPRGETRSMQRSSREAGLGQHGPVRSPFSLMRRMFEDMDRLWEDFGGGRGSAITAFEPQIDVFQRDGKLVVRADVPGVKREDIRVHVEDDAIVIAGERNEEREQKDEGWFQSERVYGSFERHIPLPRGTDAAACDAQFKDGVLEITLPLPKQSRRQIDVRGEEREQKTE